MAERLNASKDYSKRSSSYSNIGKCNHPKSTSLRARTGLQSLDMRVQVECYSAYKAEERPVRFRIEGHEYFVEEVVDQWYGPSHAWYKVRGDDGNLYILRRDMSVPDGIWDLVSFRQAAG